MLLITFLIIVYGKFKDIVSCSHNIFIMKEFLGILIPMIKLV